MTNKLPCHVVRDLLPLYADDLLSPGTQADVEAHLKECESCRRLHSEMTSPVPELNEDEAEVDYLKKISRGKRNLVTAAAILIALVLAGSFIYAKAQAAKADISYDEASRTMVIYGKDDTNLKLPETVNEAGELDAQFDSFHVKIHLPVLRTGETELAEYLPAYLGRTNQSLKFIRGYLKENCPDIDLADRAEKYVELSIMPDGAYTWKEEADRIALDIGDFYWHREELYILSLLGSRTVEWPQLGYAWYLGACVDPYNEQGDVSSIEGLKDAPYYEPFVRAGGTEENTPENFKILCDAISYVCLTKGMYWGSAYESMPLYRTAVYSGPAKQLNRQNEMSVLMAASFIGWLSGEYGFDRVSEFCFRNQKFDEAFGTDWQSAYDAWSEAILKACGGQE